ncbi:MAG TPA: NAD(P)H-dependent oxidoreductase [Rhizomicrobium sp.]|jgi:NAD(P)H dehydrogenase (quinone)|nr:NAD(P)H-dependent oxidoreductase [Rhizomicrobium sp.]
MRHAVIFAHPNADSFTAAVAQAYEAACRRLGHEVLKRDLYRLSFDPRLGSGELPFAPDFTPAPDVVLERALLQNCDIFAFVYPLWLNSPPAMMKGYLERVFGFGFAYGGGGHSYNPLLGGRKFISFSSSGAPTFWMEQTGSLGAVHALFDDYFASLTGMAALEHVHAGSVTHGASEFFVRARLDDVGRIVKKHFGGMA